MLEDWSRTSCVVSIAFIDIRKALLASTSVVCTCFNTEQNKVISVPKDLISLPSSPRDVANSYKEIESFSPQHMTLARLGSAVSAGISAIPFEECKSLDGELRLAVDLI